MEKKLKMLKKGICKLWSLIASFVSAESADF
jgi:hypothetical protein